MNLQPTYNEFGSPVKFYRFQAKNSHTTYDSDSRFGFLAGDYHDADHFPNLDNDKQRSIVQDHSNWSKAKASPFISTTTDLAWAISVAKRIRRLDPIYIAEISPGRAISGSIRYYHWFELVRELNAKIEHKAKNYHEFVFLGQIPQEAITWYGTVEESEIHNFEEEDEDLEQEHEQEGDDEEDEEEKELMSLMSRLKMERDDDQEGEETEEVEERYNQLAVADDQLKMKRVRADQQEEETEEVKDLTLVYNQMMADDIDEQYFWEEDTLVEEEDFDFQKFRRSVGSLTRSNYIL